METWILSPPMMWSMIIQATMIQPPSRFSILSSIYLFPHARIFEPQDPSTFFSLQQTWILHRKSTTKLIIPQSEHSDWLPRSSQAPAQNNSSRESKWAVILVSLPNFSSHSPNLVVLYLDCQLLEAQFTQPAGVEVYIWMSKIQKWTSKWTFDYPNFTVLLELFSCMWQLLADC